MNTICTGDSNMTTRKGINERSMDNFGCISNPLLDFKYVMWGNWHVSGNDFGINFSIFVLGL